MCRTLCTVHLCSLLGPIADEIRNQGRIQDVWKGGGAAAVPFEDPLWNFKRGGGRRGRAPSLALLEDPLWNFKRGGGARAPCAPPESASGNQGQARVL